MSIEDSRVSNLTFQKFLLVENLCFLLTYVSLFGNILYSESEMKNIRSLEMEALINMSTTTVLLSNSCLIAVMLTIVRYVFLMQLR
jgi:hypothetical protein